MRTDPWSRPTTTIRDPARLRRLPWPFLPGIEMLTQSCRAKSAIDRHDLEPDDARLRVE